MNKPLSMQIDLARRTTRSMEIILRYGEGEPVRDIEEKYDCSKNTVLRLARSAGLSKRVKSFPTEVRNAVILLYKEKVPIAEIQARLGVSQAYISKTATEERINRRNFRRGK